MTGLLARIAAHLRRRGPDRPGFDVRLTRLLGDEDQLVVGVAALEKALETDSKVAPPRGGTTGMGR